MSDVDKEGAEGDGTDVGPKAGDSREFMEPGDLWSSALNKFFSQSCSQLMFYEVVSIP